MTYAFLQASSSTLYLFPMGSPLCQFRIVRGSLQPCVLRKKSELPRFKGELTKHGAKTGILTWRELLSRRLVFSGGSTVAGSILSLFPEEQ